MKEKTTGIVEEKNQKRVNESEKKTERKRANKLVWKTAGLALFWIVALWGFWSHGTFAFGINATAFLILFFAIFLDVAKTDFWSKKIYPWMIPTLLIAISFSIFENPFLKVISFLVLPIIVAVFFTYAFLETRKNRKWDFIFLLELFFTRFVLIAKLGIACKTFFRKILFIKKEKSENKKGKKIFKKVALGILIFFLLAVFLFVPLLSSADPVFAEKIGDFFKWIGEIFSLKYFWRVVFFVPLSIFFLSLFISLKKTNDREAPQKKKQMDPIVSGIVLGGILGLYLLFIFIQLKYLWVDMLPINFEDTESFVKSGFWQLFFLSLINILTFYFFYRKTNSIVQGILTVFTATSFLILLSAGQRMYLYVLNYGFSYEKFFATYTVLFLGIVFVWLFVQLFRKKEADIFKFLIFLLLWMYAILTISPVERMVLLANIELSKRPETKINLDELTMLSADVLPIVENNPTMKEYREYEKRICGDEKNKDTESYKSYIFVGENEEKVDCSTWTDWELWVDKKKKKLNEKKWYEKNIQDLMR